MSNPPRTRQSHGTGQFNATDFAALGEGTVFEPGVLVFHPEQIYIGARVYVGHQTILKGYHRNRMEIADDVWIGQQCFFHSAGGLSIGRAVGIGPGVRIITSRHAEAGREVPILHAPLEFGRVTIAEGADVGVGAIVLPGVSIGRGAQIGAGAVVTTDIPEFAVAAGVPARILRYR